MFELNSVNDKNTEKNVKNSFPMFELMANSSEKIIQLRGTIQNDSGLFKQYFKVWFHLAFFESDFEKQIKHHLKTFAFFTPNLIEPSNKGFTNQIIENEQALNPKLIENHHRKFKHILRDLYPDQRP